MKDFIARFGYTLSWGLGIPKNDLETNYNGFYRFGLAMIITTIIAIIILLCLLLVLIIINKIEYRSEKI